MSKTMTKEQYSKLLDQVQEYLPYAVQQLHKKTGEWKTVGNCVRGREAAYVELNNMKKADPKASFRVLPKNEADKYREGIALGRKLGPEEKEPRKKLPQMYMPDNL